jgi:hypothetical protein
MKEGDLVSHDEVVPPQVFLSYAGADRAEAEKLDQALRDQGIDPFLDVLRIRPGDNVVLEINRALARSDYFVLLWSATTPGREWVEDEYAAALALERSMEKKRCFLFVVRLDDSDLPPLLAPRRYLDVRGGDFAAVAHQLAVVWRADLGEEVPVMPVPADRRSAVHIYVRNRSLSWAYELSVPNEISVRELDWSIRGTLHLKDEQTAFNGAAGLRFRYQYFLSGAPISDDPAMVVRLPEGATVDVLVWLEPFGPDGALGTPTPYLPGRSGPLSPKATRVLITQAFQHLQP